MTREQFISAWVSIISCGACMFLAAMFANIEHKSASIIALGCAIFFAVLFGYVLGRAAAISEYKRLEMTRSVQ